jgi:putative lumazine-binding protein
MPRSALILAAVAVLAIAGCTTQGGSNDSSGKFKGEQRLVANTVEDFESAASKGDQDQICRDLLAKPLVGQFAKQGGTCEKAVDSTLKDTDSFGLTVESVSINGNQAVAHVKADHGKKDVERTLTLVKEGAGWRISEFGSG